MYFNKKRVLKSAHMTKIRNDKRISFQIFFFQENDKISTLLKLNIFNSIRSISII